MRNGLCSAGIDAENPLTLLPLMPPLYLLLMVCDILTEIINGSVSCKPKNKKHASQIYNQQHQIELMLSINDYSTHTTDAAATAVIVDDVIGLHQCCFS